MKIIFKESSISMFKNKIPLPASIEVPDWTQLPDKGDSVGPFIVEHKSFEYNEKGIMKVAIVLR